MLYTTHLWFTGDGGSYSYHGFTNITTFTPATPDDPKVAPLSCRASPSPFGSQSPAARPAFHAWGIHGHHPATEHQLPYMFPRSRSQTIPVLQETQHNPPQEISQLGIPPLQTEKSSARAICQNAPRNATFRLSLCKSLVKNGVNSTETKHICK